MSGNRGILCPQCGIGILELALRVQVEARLTQRPDGGYGIGSVTQSPAQVRKRLEREHCDSSGRLILEGSFEDETGGMDGEVVFCSYQCGFTGHVTENGIEK